MNSTTLKARRFFLHLNHFQKCKGYLKRLVICWLQFQFSFSLEHQYYSLSVARISTMIRRHVHAVRDHVFPAWTATALSITVNLRVYLGWCLVGVSPAAACLHMWFDRSVKIDGWYHENCFHLFMLLGPYLFCLCVLLGIYMIVPPAKERSIKVFKRTLRYQTNRLMSYPIGFVIGKLIWLTMTSSNEDYWSLPGASIFLVGLSVAYLTLTQIDYWTWKKFHAFDGLVSSLEGLYNSPHLDHNQKIQLAKPYWNELKDFNSKY